MNKDLTFLSFPVKSNGNIILIGPDMRLNERASTDFRTLQIFDQSSSWPAGIKRAAKSIPYYNKSQYDKLSGKLIVGFAPYVNYGTRKYQPLGRTFVSPIWRYVNSFKWRVSNTDFCICASKNTSSDDIGYEKRGSIWWKYHYVWRKSLDPI